MINFNDELGAQTMERIIAERVIWLTTVSQNGVPQPRPVWFIWENGDFIMYSTPQARKLSHIAGNPNVSLHFNTDENGYNVQVILGKAKIDPSLPASDLNKLYSTKYGIEILSLNMSEEKYARVFNTGIRITPVKLRGLDPIPAE